VAVERVDYAAPVGKVTAEQIPCDIAPGYPSASLVGARVGARWIEILAPWLIVTLFVTQQAALIKRGLTGPFFDESIYITSGLRTLHGFGSSDGYLGWFAGSLLWPALSGLGYLLAGLAGARAMALCCVTVALVAVMRTTHHLFGRAAGVWAGLALAVSGPMLALAHLAVIDSLSLAGIGLSLWAVTALARYDTRLWLLIAAVAFSLGVLAKYPMVIFGLPLAGLIVTLRRPKALMDLVVFSYAVLAILLGYVLPVRMQVDVFVAWRLVNNPGFGTTTEMVRYTVLMYIALPGILGALGVIVARGRRRVAAILWAALLIWPLYHVITNNPVGFSKHVTFGYLFCYPLVGLLLATLWRRVVSRVAVLVAIAVLGLVGMSQMASLDSGWPDVRQEAHLLQAQVRPGDRLLINDSWPYIQYLYGARRIRSPWDVYDAYRLAHHQNPVGLCRFDWFIDEEGSYSWPTSVRSRVLACGTFKEVSSLVSRVTNLGRTLAFVTYPVQTTIWHRIGEVRERRGGVAAHRAVMQR